MTREEGLHGFYPTKLRFIKPLANICLFVVFVFHLADDFGSLGHNVRLGIPVPVPVPVPVTIMIMVCSAMSV